MSEAICGDDLEAVRDFARAHSGVLLARMRKSIIIAAFAGGIIALLCAAVFVFDPARDPADRFKVARITSEPGLKSHAVTYWYEHANSSNSVLGIWVVSGTPPAIGSTMPPRGAPAAIWTGALDSLRQEWKWGRLAISAEGISDASNELNECLF